LRQARVITTDSTGDEKMPGTASGMIPITRATSGIQSAMDIATDSAKATRMVMGK